LLEGQGFHAPLNKYADVQYVGMIKERDAKYKIYYYRYVFPENKRGIGRLIVIMNGEIYIGSYDVTTTNSCRTAERTVVCETWSGYDKKIHFTKRGPPRLIHLDGRLVEFDYGTFAKKTDPRSK
jgi:hypothetical protein